MIEFLIESEHDYHSQAGEFLSSHLLQMFARCPQLYYAAVYGSYRREDTEAYSLGRAVHCAVLEGMDELEKRYTCNSPVNPSTGAPYGIASKKYEQWAVGQRAMGLDPINELQMKLLLDMIENFGYHKEAAWLLGMAPHREVVLRTEYCGVQCQVRIDACGDDIGIVDLKTCDSLNRLPSAAVKYGYFSQLAFYREVLQASGLDFMPDVHLIGIEKQFPYRTGVWLVSKSSLDFARDENELNISQLVECKMQGNWPTGYEEKRELSLPKYITDNN